MAGRSRPDLGVNTTPGSPISPRSPRITVCGPGRDSSYTRLAIGAKLVDGVIGHEFSHAPRPRAVRLQVREAGVVVEPFQAYQQVVGGQLLGEALAPLDHDRRVRQVGVQVQVVDL